MYPAKIISILLFGIVVTAKPLQIQISISDDRTHHNGDGTRLVHKLSNKNHFKGFSPQKSFKLVVVDPESLEPIQDNGDEFVLGISPLLVYPPWVSLIPSAFAGHGNLELREGRLQNGPLGIVAGSSGQLITAGGEPGLPDLSWDVVAGKDGIQNLVPVNEGEAMAADSFRVERVAFNSRVFVCIPGKTSSRSCSDDLEIVTFKALLQDED